MNERARQGFRTAAFGLVALLALAGCSTDSPVAPQQTPNPDPTGQPSGAWVINVSSSPNTLTAGGTSPTTITVRIRRTDGTPPADGTTFIVSASLGELFASGSGQASGVLTVVGGRASFLLFPGTIAGSSLVTARLEQSSGRTTVSIESAPPIFITGLSPTVGPQAGGTRVTITGSGFQELLRVFFGGVPGVVRSVNNAETQIVVDAPAYAGEFTTESCVVGTATGERNINTAVEVEVERDDGESDSLAAAFTYIPADTSCRVSAP